ncbi:RNA polymerase sigma factor [Paraflavitalea pollutisoli]|uniref:RNA polymerase sigma factor n=1 Tax=Paraflavitalea pollutisoli TaxID=3034143 RepID=UPI0023EDE2C3|nr:RNA polymerase sigma-70 factor [Paraflavitalea sp. H1-2-19X]
MSSNSNHMVSALIALRGENTGEAATPAQPLTAILGGKAQHTASRPELPNERYLLDQVALGDEKAFARLVAHYWRILYGQALTYLKSTHQAQDIVQEVFVKVWEKRHQLPAIEKFDAYLFIVARNHLISALRKKIATPLDRDIAEQLPAAGNPDEQLSYKQLQQHLTTAVNSLPAQQKTAYLLSRHEGLSFEAIASQMGLSRETVKKHICRALQSIRVYIRRHNDLVLLLPLLLPLIYRAGK